MMPQTLMVTLWRHSPAVKLASPAPISLLRPPEVLQEPHLTLPLGAIHGGLEGTSGEKKAKTHISP